MIMNNLFSGMEGILGELGNLRLRDMYKRLDDKYIKPCLLRENHFKDPKIIETFENLKEKDTREFMKNNASQFTELSKIKTESSIAQPVANIDPKELHYSQTQKDLDETRIHHMLSENLFMPKNRPRKLSYSRHAINDHSEPKNLNHKSHMNVRRMMSENKNLRKRVTGASKVLQDDHVHEALQTSVNKAQVDNHSSDEEGFISFSSRLRECLFFLSKHF